MNLNSRIKGILVLSEFMACFGDSSSSIPKENNIVSDSLYKKMEDAICKIHQQNGWFTEQNVRKSIMAWSAILTKEKLESWTKNYQIGNKTNLKSVGIIMAGNIPLVGFHDLISVIISGNKALIKLSSDDNVLIPILMEALLEIKPDFNQYFQLVARLEDYDAIIATGSDNSARYFEYYFGKKPHIIRKNRTSIALLDGRETKEELLKLADDIFLYFGLGCRNVSKLYVPKDYNIDLIFEALYSHKEIIHHNKYANNYDYNKAIYLLNNESILENGFLLMRETKDIHSPIAVLLYERYDTIEQVKKDIISQSDNLQCVVSHKDNYINSVDFGKTQQPELWDYADGIDSLDFLSRIM